MDDSDGSVAVGIVADDLTGAMDTAHGFAARGYATTVRAGRPTEAITIDGETAVLSVNTNSRYSDGKAAATAVAETIERVPAWRVYKKVDSTLRGNFTAEVEAALGASGAAVALVAPAFPSAGRTTEGGVHYVEGVAVAETEYGDDEKGPATSAIPDLFESVDRPVVTIPLETVEAGRDAVAAAIEDAVAASERPPVAVCDAREDAHLGAIAAAGADRDGEVLYVGSGGLAERMTLGGVETAPPSMPTFAAGAPLGVVGSVSETTLTQLGRVPDEAIVELDGSALLTGGDPEAAIERATERLDGGRPVVMTSATDRAAVERTLAAGRRRGLTDAEIRDRVATGLARIARRVHDASEPSGLFVTGGDIAIAVIDSLAATAVSLTGMEVEAGIPIGRLADGVAAGTPLITKAGGFGTDEAIVDSLVESAHDIEE